MVHQEVGPLDTAQGTALAMQFRQYVAKHRKPQPPATDPGEGRRIKP